MPKFRFLATTCRSDCGVDLAAVEVGVPDGPEVMWQQQGDEQVPCAPCPNCGRTYSLGEVEEGASNEAAPVGEEPEAETTTEASEEVESPSGEEGAGAATATEASEEVESPPGGAPLL
ncbi:hypothetical protein LCGC14_2567390 [marine sediment metagenome]|uniref:Uncharacterized protein n=1 Tax=marine sediment metagenome TaxID=412755 RepID=A0A0F9AI89_9ZZZZ